MRARRVRRSRRTRRAPMYSQPRIRDEMKTKDTAIAMNFDNAVTNTSSNVLMINEVAQGNSALTRIGKRVVMKACQIRGRVQLSGTSAMISNKCTVLLVYVRSVNSTGAATAPPVGEVLTSADSNALTNRNYASKYKILRRWDFIVNGSSTDFGDKSRYNFEEYIVFKKPLVTQWSSGGIVGNYAEVEKGALLLMSTGEAANSTNTPIFVANARLYFNESDGYVY